MLNWALASWSSVWIGATIGLVQHAHFHILIDWSI